MAELGALAAMAEQGALAAMAEQGALATMAELGKFKMILWAQQDINTGTPGRNMWTGSTGLESAAGRWA